MISYAISSISVIYRMCFFHFQALDCRFSTRKKIEPDSSTNRKFFETTSTVLQEPPILWRSVSTVKLFFSFPGLITVCGFDSFKCLAGQHAVVLLT